MNRPLVLPKLPGAIVRSMLTRWTWYYHYRDLSLPEARQQAKRKVRYDMYRGEWGS